MAKYLDYTGLSRVWEKIKAYITSYITSLKDEPGGFATITVSGTVSDNVLPSSVKNVVDAWPIYGATPTSQGWLKDGYGDEGYIITPTSGKIYILMADSGSYQTNNMFRWNGSAYVKLT